MKEILLSSAPQGGRFRVKRHLSCMRQRRHFCALGLTPGTEIELRRRECCGACSLMVRDGCLVLDPESASSIVCEPVQLAPGCCGAFNK